ncbi:hypothetical protein AB6A40_008739 [Gnathostoma spinigerum]|uniref:Uncharacterized protein n=1 Tax=Gnathostoma spinigerum TaxID=75299 RepID=A0ABD6ER66_9BILA
MMQTEHKIVGETVTTPIIKYPTAFLEYLTTLLDFVCDSNIRIYHRTEAASCATAFMRKDLVNDEKYGKKFWNRVAVSLGEFMHLCFATLKKNDVKPRFFAYIMRMMLAFAHAASPSQKKILNEKIGADLSSLITDGKLVENDKKMKNVNSSIQYICNRGLVAALSQLERLIT